MLYLKSTPYYHINTSLEPMSDKFNIEVCNSETGVVTTMSPPEAVKNNVLGCYCSGMYNGFYLMEINKYLLKLIEFIDKIEVSEERVPLFFGIELNDNANIFCSSFETCVSNPICKYQLSSCLKVKDTVTFGIRHADAEFTDPDNIFYFSLFSHINILDILSDIYKRCGNVLNNIETIRFFFQSNIRYDKYCIVYSLKVTKAIKTFITKYLLLKGDVKN